AAASGGNCSNAAQAVLARSFHASAPVCKRKGGSSALKPERRAPSKAQMRRRRERLVEKREQREAKKAAARAMKTKAFLTTQQDAVAKLELRYGDLLSLSLSLSLFVFFSLSCCHRSLAA